MKEEFEMSMVGQLAYSLGLQLKQGSEGYFISQEKYAKNLVKKFDLESCKPSRTPVSTSTKVSKDETGVSVDNTVYWSLIGSLLYQTASRPDIMFSFIAAQRILKYIKGTIQYGLRYSKDSELSLIGYCDADWVGNIDDHKSTSSGCFFVDQNLSRTKHIDIRHHYTRYLVESNEIELEYIQTEKQLTDILTKPLDANQFEILRSVLGICRVD
ncbi:PREDICTED: uncharacterized protein LOC109171180 [Ipomoea nil]|uniref:uncharacterized protein LOC109171180 n=1 Tax=Ipomoea nil TaxID=35883 RepID=UPI0009013A62|nr:PREDICTED: uncharacterized protein LOC109171180 [Ipomoea nil]